MSFRPKKSGAKSLCILNIVLFKRELLELLKGTRVISHTGEQDFKSLDISTSDLRTNKIAHIDLAELFRDEKGVIKLSKIVNFFVTNGKGIQAGVHNPEIDARNPLVVYNKGTKLPQNIQKDLRYDCSIIRRHAENGKNIANYLDDCGQSSAKRGEL